jgi:5,6-dimethylbenzimidazole synthase
MPKDFAYSESEKESIYRVIRERRDVRRFRSDPVPTDVLQRILRAATQAPSVGYMQPWNFILISELTQRRRIHEAFIKANNAAMEMFVGERKTAYRSLKLEGILECGLNICVTCDRSRSGPVVLGRTSQPEMDLYSTVCAVQNLWLAARSEGIGVGWVSIIELQELSSIIGLPETVVPIAYLCVGYPDYFAVEPELKTLKWLPEVPLEDVIFYESWGKKEANYSDGAYVYSELKPPAL